MRTEELERVWLASDKFCRLRRGTKIQSRTALSTEWMIVMAGTTLCFIQNPFAPNTRIQKYDTGMDWNIIAKGVNHSDDPYDSYIDSDNPLIENQLGGPQHDDHRLVTRLHDLCGVLEIVVNRPLRSHIVASRLKQIYKHSSCSNTLWFLRAMLGCRCAPLYKQRSCSTAPFTHLAPESRSLEFGLTRLSARSFSPLPKHHNHHFEQIQSQSL